MFWRGKDAYKRVIKYHSGKPFALEATISVLLINNEIIFELIFSSFQIMFFYSV